MSDCLTRVEPMWVLREASGCTIFRGRPSQLRRASCRRAWLRATRPFLDRAGPTPAAGKFAAPGLRRASACDRWLPERRSLPSRTVGVEKRFEYCADPRPAGMTSNVRASVACNGPGGRSLGVSGRRIQGVCSGRTSAEVSDMCWGVDIECGTADSTAHPPVSRTAHAAYRRDTVASEAKRSGPVRWPATGARRRGAQATQRGGTNRAVMSAASDRCTTYSSLRARGASRSRGRCERRRGDRGRRRARRGDGADPRQGVDRDGEARFDSRGRLVRAAVRGFLGAGLLVSQHKRSATNANAPVSWSMST